MKNVQVIDDADNVTYSIFAFTDDEFAIVFPDFQNGQDIEFIEDVAERLGEDNLTFLLPVWDRYIDKKQVSGIHGTLFYGLANKKRCYYPTKRESDILLVPGGLLYSKDST